VAGRGEAGRRPGSRQRTAVVRDEQSEIVTSTLQYGDILVHDPVVYGPWLEGTSKRNRSTRFKGYHLWRLTRQRVQERAPEIAQAKIPELIAKLDGGP
jgi:hypothetical protein